MEARERLEVGPGRSSRTDFAAACTEGKHERRGGV